MLITKTVEIVLSPMNMNHFESLGYKIPREKDVSYHLRVPRGTKITVRVEDLMHASNVEVQYLCDYCLEEGKETIITEKYSFYNAHRKNIPKDCCNNVECMKKKRAEANIKLYGEEHQFKRPEVWEKIRETNMERYGEVHALKNPEIAKKLVISSREGLYRNGTGASSIQQRYIHSLIDGELNYAVGGLLLDIAYPEDMIYVEYNGKGHYMDVTVRNMDIKEFEHKERKREYFLKSQGWKEVLFISKKDLLPTADEIKELIKEGIEYLKTGHTYFEINIDESYIRCKNYKREIKFDNLINRNGLVKIFKEDNSNDLLN